jgi:HEAT repeat protein
VSDDKLQKLSDLKAIEERAVPAAAARARLRELVEDGDASVRGPAVALSGSFPGDAGLVGRVLEISRTDGEAEVRVRGLEALAEVLQAGELAGAELAGYDPAPDLGEPSAELYRDARGRLLAALEAGVEERAAALIGLAPLAGRLDVVGRAIRSDLQGDASARAVALAATGHSGASDRWAEAILAGLGDGDDRVARAAALAAGRSELSRAVPELERLLREGPALVRAGAATALGRLRGAAALAELLAVAERDSEDTVREAARLALADLKLLSEGGAE